LEPRISHSYQRFFLTLIQQAESKKSSNADINIYVESAIYNISHILFMTFEKAADAIKDSAKHNVKMTDEELLQIYSLYKQGTVGDNTTPQPGMLDFKGKAKWNAWNGLKGKSKEAAQAEYIALAKTLLQKYGLPANF